MELIDHIVGIDWENDRKKELMPMVATDTENVDYEIESKIYILIRMMAKNKVIQSRRPTLMEGDATVSFYYNPDTIECTLKLCSKDSVSDVINKLQKKGCQKARMNN